MGYCSCVIRRRVNGRHPVLQPEHLGPINYHYALDIQKEPMRIDVCLPSASSKHENNRRNLLSAMKPVHEHGRKIWTIAKADCFAPWTACSLYIPQFTTSQLEISKVYISATAGMTFENHSRSSQWCKLIEQIRYFLSDLL